MDCMYWILVNHDVHGGPYDTIRKVRRNLPRRARGSVTVECDNGDEIFDGEDWYDCTCNSTTDPDEGARKYDSYGVMWL